VAAATEVCYVCKKTRPRSKLQREPYVGAEGTKYVLVCPEHLNKSTSQPADQPER
jgi:hypothetical protein